MSVVIDPQRGRNVADRLWTAFERRGIHGKKRMPGDIAPQDVARGSLEHMLFLTLTVSIDYQRDAPLLWESSRRTYEDPATRYLFDPESLERTPLEKVRGDMQLHGLSRRPGRDAGTWRTVGVSLQRKWKGNPIYFFESCRWDSVEILDRLRQDHHLSGNRRLPDFPSLRGPKVGPLWLRLLRDNSDMARLRNLDKVPIPVDIHVARATFATGVVRGRFRGHLPKIFDCVRKVWSESTSGLRVNGSDIIALDLGEPLWHLSRHGCTFRDKQTGACRLLDRCEAREFCTRGMLRIEHFRVELDT